VFDCFNLSHVKSRMHYIMIIQGLRKFKNAKTNKSISKTKIMISWKKASCKTCTYTIHMNEENGNQGQINIFNVNQRIRVFPLKTLSYPKFWSVRNFYSYFKVFIRIFKTVRIFALFLDKLHVSFSRFWSI